MKKRLTTWIMLCAAVFLLTSFSHALAETKATDDNASRTVTFQSKYSFEETLDKLRNTLIAEQVTIFTELDHAAAAKKVDLELRPTTVFIVGNPKVGTLFMQEVPSISIDLPLRILVMENEKEETEVTYQKLVPLGVQYGLEKTKPATEKIDAKIISVIQKALEV